MQKILAAVVRIMMAFYREETFCKVFNSITESLEAFGNILHYLEIALILEKE